MDRVVPFAMKFAGLQIDMGKFFIRDLASNGVPAVVQATGHLQALGCGRAGDQPHYGFIIAQWLAAPVGRDEGKQAVLHLIPFARARREMADRQDQPGLVGQALQLPFPQPQAPAVAATAIGSNQQPPPSRGESGLGPAARPAIALRPWST